MILVNSSLHLRTLLEVEWLRSQWPRDRAKCVPNKPPRKRRKAPSSNFPQNFSLQDNAILFGANVCRKSIRYI